MSRLIDVDALITQIVVTTQEACMNMSWKQGMTYALGLVEAQPTITPEPHWISVTERLPEENYLDDGYVEPSQYVLVYMSYHVCKVSRYWGHRKTKGTSGYIIPDWMDLEEHDGDNVLAWMPLPEPYKGVTK